MRDEDESSAGLLADRADGGDRDRRRARRGRDTGLQRLPEAQPGRGSDRPALGREDADGEYFSNAKRWPAQPGDVLGTLSGKYTGSISYFGTPDNVAADVTLMATMATVGVSQELSGTTFLLETTDGGATWSCRSGGAKPISDAYLPTACK
jgi:hypothetical protein